MNIKKGTIPDNLQFIRETLKLVFVFQFQKNLLLFFTLSNFTVLSWSRNIIPKPISVFHIDITLLTNRYNFKMLPIISLYILIQKTFKNYSTRYKTVLTSKTSNLHMRLQQKLFWVRICVTNCRVHKRSDWLDNVT